MTDCKKPCKRGTCIPASVEFLNVKYDIIQENFNTVHSHLYKSYHSFAKRNNYLETGIPPLLERAMYAEIQLKMDGSNVELNTLRSQSSVNKTEMEDADFHYVKEENDISKTLCALHNSFVWNDCLGPVKAYNDYTNDSRTCTCKLMELPATCVNKTGQQLCSTYDTSRESYLCFERETQKLSAACTGHNISSGNFTGRMPSKPSLSHFENCNESYSEEMEEDFYRSKKERSTLLIRRFCKNDKEVKKSVYTGTRAIVRTIPLGHIGAVAWNCVDQRRTQNELRHCKVASEQLLTFRVSISQEFCLCLLQSIWHGVSFIFYNFIIMISF